jgi:hypothetical protein
MQHNIRIFVGLDMSKMKISVALAEEGCQFMRDYWLSNRVLKSYDTSGNSRTPLPPPRRRRRRRFRAQSVATPDPFPRVYVPSRFISALAMPRSGADGGQVSAA